MLLTKLFAPILLATSVIADGAAITRSIYIVSNSTARLGVLVDNWTGTVAGALPIVRQSDRILRQLRRGTRVANQSQPLTAAELGQMQAAIVQLTGVTNATMGSLVNRQQDFAKLKLTGSIKKALTRQRVRANKMSDAIMVKIPKEMVGTAQNVVGGIDRIFQNALNFFQ